MSWQLGHRDSEGRGAGDIFFQALSVDSPWLGCLHELWWLEWLLVMQGASAIVGGQDTLLAWGLETVCLGVHGELGGLQEGGST